MGIHALFCQVRKDRAFFFLRHPYAGLPSCMISTGGNEELALVHTLDQRRRRELLTTDTELRAMAAAAKTGLSRMPKKG